MELKLYCLLNYSKFAWSNYAYFEAKFSHSGIQWIHTNISVIIIFPSIEGSLCNRFKFVFPKHLLIKLKIMSYLMRLRVLMWTDSLVGSMVMECEIFCGYTTQQAQHWHNHIHHPELWAGKKSTNCHTFFTFWFSFETDFFWVDEFTFARVTRCKRWIVSIIVSFFTFKAWTRFWSTLDQHCVTTNNWWSWHLCFAVHHRTR